MGHTLVPPYTIHLEPSSSGTVLANQHPSPTHLGMSGVHVGSYDAVLDIPVLRGTEHDIFSKGITNTPCLNGTSILGLHPTKTLHPRISSSHMHPPQVPLIGNAQVASPGKSCPMTRRMILPNRLNPHHTPKTHAKISPVVTTLSTPSALTTPNNPPPSITS